MKIYHKGEIRRETGTPFEESIPHIHHEEKYDEYPTWYGQSFNKLTIAAIVIFVSAVLLLCSFFGMWILNYFHG